LPSEGQFSFNFSFHEVVERLVLIVVVMMIAIMMVAIAVSATPPYLFQLFPPLMRLPAVFAMTLDGVAQSVFRLVYLPFAGFVVAVIGADGNRRAYQTDNRQHYNRENLEDTSHGFSLKWIVRVEIPERGSLPGSETEFSLSSNRTLDAIGRSTVA
jgi:hypothetical protein